MARTRRETWVQHVAAWRASGLTARQFAARAGINANTLAHWKWRLGSERGGAVARTSFVEVTEAVVSATAEGEAFEVVCRGGRVVRVPRDFDAPTLVRLLDALEGR